MNERIGRYANRTQCAMFSRFRVKLGLFPKKKKTTILFWREDSAYSVTLSTENCFRDIAQG